MKIDIRLTVLLALFTAVIGSALTFAYASPQPNATVAQDESQTIDGVSLVLEQLPNEIFRRSFITRATRMTSLTTDPSSPRFGLDMTTWRALPA